MASAGKGDDNPEECPVCLTGFDDLVQRPRNLPCGHTVCTLCIDKLKELDSVTCPVCRISHAVPEAGQFPVSYTIEALIRRMRDDKVAAAAASLPSSARKEKGARGAAGKKKAVGLSKKIRSFLQEQEATVVAAITACQEAQSQLDQYEATLKDWGKQQQQLEDNLHGLVDQSVNVRDLLQQEVLRVAAKKEEAKKKVERLQAMREKLRTRAAEQEALKAMGEVLHCTSEAEQVVEECQQCFPDAGTLTTAWKVREASSAALEAAQAVQEAHEAVSTEEPRPPSDPEEPRPQADPEEPRPQADPEEPRPQADPEEYSSQADPEEPSCQSDPEDPSFQSDLDLTIMEKVKLILEPSLKISETQRDSIASGGEEKSDKSDEPLQAEELRRLTQHTRILIEAGEVFGVHQVEGQLRNSRVSLHCSKLCLHALKEQPLPLGVATVRVSEVVLPSPPCKVFLDLSWPGRGPSRVYIRLNPDTPRGRQFMLLCTGQRGPSYLGTKFFRVGNKGKNGECVCGGDYESNDGKGKCVLLPDLDKGEYKESQDAGAVCGGWWGTGQFAITTRRCDYTWDRVFGTVVEGLPVVAKAAEHSNIKEVTVVNCGMVL